MAEPGSNKPAGWYPSTRTPGMERYWNGDFWTSDYRPDPKASSNSISEPAPGANAPLADEQIRREQAQATRGGEVLDARPVPPTDVWSALQSSPAGQQPILAPGVRTEFSRSNSAPIQPGYGTVPAGYPVNYTPSAQHAQGLSTTAFILAFFVPIAGLVVGIIAYVKSKALGKANGMSIAAIVISAVFFLFTLLFWIPFFVSLFTGLGSSDYSYDDDDYDYGSSYEVIDSYSVGYAAEDVLNETYPDSKGYWNVDCDEKENFDVNDTTICAVQLYADSDYFNQDYKATVTILDSGEYYDPDVTVVLDRAFDGPLKDPGMISND